MLPIKIPALFLISLLLSLSAHAENQVVTMKSATAPAVSSSDLAQTQYLSSSATGGNQVATEHAQLFNGLIGGEDSSTAESGEVTMNSGNTVTVNFDTSINTAGYDITGIDSVFGWNPSAGGRSNQGYGMTVTFVDDSTATLVEAEHWEPNAPSSYWTKVSFTEASGGVMASGVKAITFDITEDANANGVVVAREIDVFGVPSSPYHLNYTYLYFHHGYPSPLGGRRPQSDANLAARANPDLVFQTGYYSLRLDCKTMALEGYNALAGTDYLTALTEDVTTFTPADLQLSVTKDGINYTCTSASVQNSQDQLIRMVESNRYVQRMDHLGLVFTADVGGAVLEVDGRFEMTAWPDRVAFKLDFSGVSGVTETSVRVTSPQSVVHEKVVAGDVAVLALQPHLDTTLAAFNVNDYVTEAVVQGSATPLNVEFDAAEYGVHIDVPANSVSYPRDTDRVDEYVIEVTNPGGAAENIPLIFEQPNPRQITGTVMTLCEEDGRPTGIPVQISKNWHGKAPAVHQGQWLRGYTMLNLAAGETRRFRLRVIYGYWGGAGTISHSQLCLIGFGSNWQWEESALGSWGESMTYDITQHAAGSFIGDVRPAFTIPTNTSYADHNWTENVGGGDHLIYRDSNNVYQGIKRLKTAYHWTGPNMTEVLYSGVTYDDKIRVTYSSKAVGTLDYQRRFHGYKYEFLGDVISPRRLVYHQMAADYYPGPEFTNYYRGDENGLISTGVADPGGNTYKGNFQFNDQWLAIDDEAGYENKPIQANRGILSRSSTLNGTTLPLYVHTYGRSWGDDKMLFDLSAGSVSRSYDAGDVVEGEVEFIMPPKSTASYWGSDAELINRLSTIGNAWQAVYDEFRYNQELDVTPHVGALLQNYPVEIQAETNGAVVADFTLSGGGIGHVPIVVRGLIAGQDLVAHRYINGEWVYHEWEQVTDQRNYQGVKNPYGTMDYVFNLQRPSLDLTEAWRVRIVSGPQDYTPVAYSASKAVLVDGSQDITLSGSDLNGDSLSYTIESSPANGTLTGTGANRTYTPNPGFVGIDLFTYTVSDGGSDSDIATVSIDVVASGLVAHWALNETNGTDVADSSGNGFDAALVSGTWTNGYVGGALDFNAGSDSVTLPADPFSLIRDEISIALWVYGDTTQPRSDTVLYASNTAGERVLNIHLPWSGSRVFWDAGYDDDYDRINKVANDADFKEQWNHWVFTKNATAGTMKIYLNGVLWHSGTGATKSMAGITEASLGSALDGSSYDGLIDDVKLYSIALSAQEVENLYSENAVEPIDFTDWYLGEKRSLFVHYSYGGPVGESDQVNPPGSIYPDGTNPTSVEEVASGLDADLFAEDCQKFGFDSVIFTVAHRGMYLLYPSEVMNDWGFPNHTSETDLIGEVITACKARGIEVVLYANVWTLPEADREVLGWNDTDNYLKFNDDMNDWFAEMLERYGDDINGWWFDAGLAHIDKPRLSALIQSYNPDQAFYLGTDNRHYSQSDPDSWIDNWAAVGRNNSMYYGGPWYARYDESREGRRFEDRTVEYLYKYTVLQAACVGEGTALSGHPYVGSALWGAGPYVGGDGCDWESGVEEDSILFGQRIRAVEESVTGTRPSSSYITEPGSTVNTIESGIVATRSVNRANEYIHVLRPPSGATLSLSPPANNAEFNPVGEILPSGELVEVVQNASGVTIVMPENYSWDPIGTVIKLGVDYTPPPVVSVVMGVDRSRDMTLWSADFSGDSITYTIVTAPTNGTLTGSGPDRTYTPDPGYVGSDHFTYIVSDGESDSELATALIEVLPIVVTSTTSSTMPTVSTNDLAQTHYLRSYATGSNEVVTQHADLFNGLIGSADNDTAEPGVVTMNSGNTITVEFDLSTNMNGYDLTGITTVFGWNAGGGGRSNQGYELIVTYVDGSTDILIPADHWEPNDPSFYWTSVSFADLKGVLASGVKAVTFDITEDANPGGVVVAREFDIFGVPTAGFTTWLTAYPALVDSSLLGDPEGDGIENVLEYVLDGDPTAVDTLILPELDATGENLIFSFMRRVESAGDTTQVFQYSTTLESDDWTDMNVTDPKAAEVSIGSVVDGIQSVTVTIPRSIAPDGQLFGRLQVTVIP